MRFSSVCRSVATAMLLLWLSSSWAHARPETQVSVSAKPLVFERNQGQYAGSADFLLAGDGFNFHVAPSPVIELFHRVDGPHGADSRPRTAGTLERVQIPIHFQGSRSALAPVGLEPVAERRNYISGSDENDWHTNVPSFRKVRYPEFYPGVALEYRVTDSFPEYVFHLEPGADPAAIGFSFGKDASVSIDGEGRLQVVAGDVAFSQRAPQAWQLRDGEREPVPAGYRIEGGNVHFELADHDPNRKLLIDPVLDFSSYFGGPESDRPIGVHTDSNGNIYVVGESSSKGLASPGAFEETNPTQRTEQIIFPSCADCEDSGVSGQVERVAMRTGSDAVFVTKLAPDGSQRLWTTYIRSEPASAFNFGINSTGISSTGEVAFALTSATAGWPLLNEAQPFDVNQENAYVAKLSADGTALEFGTYLHLAGSGGFAFIQRGLDVGPSGEVVAVGAVAAGNNLPEVDAIIGQSCTLNAAENELTEPFVTLFSATGNVTFSSCIGGDVRGGAALEWARGVAVGSDGRLYVVGYTSMTDFPLVNPVQNAPGYPGARPAFISIIDPSTAPATLDFSTYYGAQQAGSAGNAFFPIDIIADAAGEITITGTTNELHYPAVNAFQADFGMPRQSYGIDPSRFSEAQDLFLTRIDPGVPEVVFSTYLGGRELEDGLNALAADAAGNIYVSSVTRSADYPVAAPIQGAIAGETNLGVSKFTPDGKLVWSTFLGGSDDRMIQIPGGIAIDPVTGNVVAAAWTASSDFPLVDPLQAFNAGEHDVAIAIIDQSGDVDSDGDGVIDVADAFPGDPLEWRDTDGDGQGDAADPDLDGDGVANASDAFPQDPLWSADADGDGVGDASDLFPSDPLLAYDFDGDGIGDFADDDLDGDGTPNAEDAFPADPAFAGDVDGDGIPDSVDTDNDNDGIPDQDDPAPLDGDVPVITFNQFDPFNTNVFKSPLPDGFSTPAGAVAWTADTGTTETAIAFSETRSLGTRLVADSELAAVELVKTFESGTLVFQYRVDSEPNADVLKFLLDGSELLAESGDTGWREARFPIAAGERTLTWRYEKDGSGASGLDAAWIDDIVVRRIGDVSVDIENGVTTVRAGGQTTFEIPVTNSSLNPAELLTLNVTMPPQYSNGAWTCESAGGGAVCPAAVGSGPISETFDLPPDGELLYRLTVDIQSGPEEPVVISAALSIGSDYIDEMSANNTAEDADFVGIFGTDFE